jgi:hypothetical protein
MRLVEKWPGVLNMETYGPYRHTTYRSSTIKVNKNNRNLGSFVVHTRAIGGSREMQSVFLYNTSL